MAARVKSDMDIIASVYGRMEAAIDVIAYRDGQGRQIHDVSGRMGVACPCCLCEFIREEIRREMGK